MPARGMLQALPIGLRCAFYI